ncbi:MAG: hypothetical protein L0215_07085 [Gemmataceae bacterium]|nr:hypothetical protein [Gemmataceae bacterium]
MQSNRPKRVILTTVMSVVLASIAIVVIGWLFWPAKQNLPLARLQSVEVGMTRAQVWDVVGPPGIYPRGSAYFHRVGVLLGDEVWRCAGSGNELHVANELHVWYDRDERVVDAVVYVPGVAPPERFISRLWSK